MKIGDVLYSTKSLVTSTKIVGHVGIVGPDYRIYHVNPVDEVAGKRDTVETYSSRHGANETIYIYRPRSGGQGAADWAAYAYSYAKVYDIINLQPLNTLSPNYCSKFIWQAFFYSNSGDITNLGLTGSSTAFVTPGHIKNASIFTNVGSFTTK
ncbi:hypothetical protein ACIQXI_02010 [Lysinibacillus sp. NPDC097195]|uniref:hypothetical protein n=1 Tax=Lysinibacillus sp. NPDC097195 TaxID=3364141 RepID=UPI00382C771B